MTKQNIVIAAFSVFVTTAALLGAVTQPFVRSMTFGVSATVDPIRLHAHVRELSERLVPRDWTHPENLDRTAAYIRREFEMAGADVHEQVYAMRGRTYRNVVATFGKDTSDVVVVGAHYDAFGTLPGADDNASGVAGLIELAHLVGATTVTSRVELVAFTLEEPDRVDGPGLFRGPHGGSAVHAASLRSAGRDVRVMLNLETIGVYKTAAGTQAYPVMALGLAYPSHGDFVAIVGKFGQGSTVRRVKAAFRSATALPTLSLSAPALVRGVDWSDHANYWDAGYPAVMITDTALYRNLNYHTARDTAETLDYIRMAEVVRGVFAATKAFRLGSRDTSLRGASGWQSRPSVRLRGGPNASFIPRLSQREHDAAIRL